MAKSAKKAVQATLTASLKALCKQFVSDATTALPAKAKVSDYKVRTKLNLAGNHSFWALIHKETVVELAEQHDVVHVSDVLLVGEMAPDGHLSFTTTTFGGATEKDIAIPSLK